MEIQIRHLLYTILAAHFSASEDYYISAYWVHLATPRIENRIYIYIYPLWLVSFETTNHLGVSKNKWKTMANWPFNQKIMTNPRILGLNWDRSWRQVLCFFCKNICGILRHKLWVKLRIYQVHIYIYTIYIYIYTYLYNKYIYYIYILHI